MTSTADIVETLSSLFELVNRRSVFLHCLNDTNLNPPPDKRTSVLPAATAQGWSVSLACSNLLAFFFKDNHNGISLLYRVGQKTGPYFKVYDFCIGDLYIKMFSSLSGVKLVFGMSPYLNILGISLEKRYCAENIN